MSGLPTIIRGPSVTGTLESQSTANSSLSTSEIDKKNASGESNYKDGWFLERVVHWFDSKVRHIHDIALWSLTPDSYKLKHPECMPASFNKSFEEVVIPKRLLNSTPPLTLTRRKINFSARDYVSLRFFNAAPWRTLHNPQLSAQMLRSQSVNKIEESLVENVAKTDEFKELMEGLTKGFDKKSKKMLNDFAKEIIREKAKPIVANFSNPIFEIEVSDTDPVKEKPLSPMDVIEIRKLFQKEYGKNDPNVRKSLWEASKDEIKVEVGAIVRDV